MSQAPAIIEAAEDRERRGAPNPDSEHNSKDMCKQLRKYIKEWTVALGHYRQWRSKGGYSLGVGFRV